jgi:hypothetical protein
MQFFERPANAGGACVTALAMHGLITAADDPD